MKYLIGQINKKIIYSFKKGKNVIKQQHFVPSVDTLIKRVICPAQEVVRLFATGHFAIYKNNTQHNAIPTQQHSNTVQLLAFQQKVIYFFLIGLGQLRAVGIRPYYQGAGWMQ